MKKVNSMKQRTYESCGACGELHPSDEMEVVVVRIKKGKDCKLERNDMFAKPAAPAVRTVVDARDASHLNEDGEVPVKNILPPQLEAKKKIVQHQHFAGMMVPPGDPRFESHGAKEHRQA